MSNMHMSRIDRRWWEWSFTFKDADGNPITDVTCEASFDGKATWIPADTTAGTNRWMVSAPDYNADEDGMPPVPDGVDVIPLTATLSPWVRAIEPFEVEAWQPGSIIIED